MVHPNSLANLTPFKPGQSGNPGGSRSAGAHIREWMNAMADLTPDEILEIYKDPKTPAAKKAAARNWLHAMSAETNEVGNPIAGPEMDRIMDRTEGKPKQGDLNVNHNHAVLSLDQMIQRLQALGAPIDRWPLRAQEHYRRQIESKVVETNDAAG